MKLFLCLIKHHAVKTLEQWKYGPCILKPGASWRGPLAFTLYPGENILPYALDRTVGKPAGRSECSRDYKISFPTVSGNCVQCLSSPKAVS